MENRPTARGWSRRNPADASPSYVTPHSPEKKEMAADVSKRRDKEEKIDVSVLLALGGAKKVGAGCRTPVQPSLKEGTPAMQMESRGNGA